MKKMILPILATIWLFVGCSEPVPHYNRVAVASLTGAPSDVPVKMHGKVKPYGSVKLFQSKEEVAGNYNIIAIMSVEGQAGDEAKFITAFLYRAADLGADAIILYRVNLATVITGSSGGFVVGSHGGFGWESPGDTHNQAFYRAEAIRFKSAP
jgi:hypothetical protein